MKPTNFSTEFISLFDASKRASMSEAEIVSYCSDVWMDCDVRSSDIPEEFTPRSRWLGVGTISGKRTMPLWGKLTSKSVVLLIERLKGENTELRGLRVVDPNVFGVKEEVELLDFDYLSIHTSLPSDKSFQPDKPILYVQQSKLVVIPNNSSRRIETSGVDVLPRKTEPIPPGALLKLKTQWPVNNLVGVFSKLVEQNLLDPDCESFCPDHFSCNLLDDPVPQETPKLNWLSSKASLRALMINLEINTAEVHKHFSHKGQNMTPINAGLKSSERHHLNKMQELIRSFRP